LHPFRVSAPEHPLLAALLCSAALAASALTAAEKPAPADAAKDYADIQKLVKAGSHHQAAEKLGEFIRHHIQWERLKEAELLYGIELVESGKLALGQDRLKRYLEVHRGEPETVRARFYMARAEEALGLFEQAVLSYELIQKQHPEHALAPDALLAAGMLSGKVVGKYDRAREIYDRFFDAYPKHPLVPALHNHLGRLAELATAEIEEPFIQDWYVIGPFPSPENAGFAKEFPPEKGVDLQAKYDVSEVQQASWKPVPLEAKGETGLINLLPLFAPNEYVVAYAWTTTWSGSDRKASMLLGTDDAFGVWINGEKVQAREVYRPTGPDQNLVPIRLKKGKNEILLKITQAQGEWSFCCRLVDGYVGGPGAAVYLYQEYARKFPNDPGNRLLNGPAAGPAGAIWYSTNVPRSRLNDPSTSALLYEEYEKLPGARKGEGYIAAARILAGSPWAGDAEPRFKKALQAQPDNELWRFEYTRWLKTANPEDPAPAEQELAILATTARDPKVIAAALKELTEERLTELVKKHPRDFTILSEQLSRLKDERRPEGRKLLDGAQRVPGVDWRERICRQWFEWTGELADCIAWRSAAAAEGRIPEAAEATLKIAQLVPQQTTVEEALPDPFRELEGAVRSWAAYPNFPRDRFAVAIVKAAANKETKAQALKLIVEHNLAAGAEGLDALADLRIEVQPDKAADDMLAACVAAVRENKPDIFRRQLAQLEKTLGATHPKLAEAVFEIGGRGPEFWKDLWPELITPLVGRLAQHFKSVNPPTAESRLALVRLGRFQDAKQSVARHDEFLKNHPGDPNAVWVRLNRFRELKRAESPDIEKELAALAKEIPKNPALAQAVPPELLARGPGAYELYVHTVRELKPANAKALLQLARVQLAQNDHMRCFQTVQRIVKEHGARPEASEAKQIGVRLFEGGRFPHGLGQQEAQTAFGWLMDLALSSEERSFERLAGNVWRLACHPYFRHSYVRGVEANPVELSRATQNRGAWGLQQWDAYVRKFPRDARGGMMRLQTLAWTQQVQAVREFDALRKAHPHNLRYQAERAECLWRLGKAQEALAEYKKLAEAREHDRFNCDLNDLHSRVVFSNRRPPNWRTEYKLRLRAVGDWNSWLALETEKDAANGPLAARVQAAADLDAMKQQLDGHAQQLGQLNAELERAKAQEEAAAALAQKKDAEQKQLQQRIELAKREQKELVGREAALRRAVGLKPDQVAVELPLNYALERMDRELFSSTLLVDLVNRTPAEQYGGSVEKVLVNICINTGNYGHVNWAIGELTRRFPEKPKLNRTALLLTDLALRNPLDGTHLRWLQGSCDLAGGAGNVYLYSRNSKILSRLQPQNPAYSALRSGEVFQNAGNIASAEFQYRLAIKAADTPEAKRKAMLTLARLYQDQGRPHDALRILSDLVDIEVPKEKR